MNANELFHAAKQIQDVVTQTQRLSQGSGNKTLQELHRQVAEQLQDRADQVRCWAQSVRDHEDRNESLPANVAFRIQSATREFLAMATGGGK